MRTDHTQLPGNKELKDILERESKRPLPVGQEKVHYPNFEAIINLCKYYNVASTLFTKEYELADVYTNNITEAAGELIHELCQDILASGENPSAVKVLDDLFDYLAEEDAVIATDILFVFGNKGLLRAAKAVELYDKKIAPKIVFSGNHPFYDVSNPTPEAIQYKEYAIGHGVPEDAIITEVNSFSIPDNVKSSLNMLDEKGEKFSRVVLINSPYSQRRGWVHFKKYVPDTVVLIRVNADPHPDYTKETWYKQEKSIKAVLNEFIKMKIGILLNSA